MKLQEDAGLDIVGDGEQARVHFVHGFLANLDGIDFGKKTMMGIRNNRYQAEVPTVTGPIRRKGPGPRHGGEGRARANRPQAQVHAARPDDHRRHHRRRALRPARGPRHGLRAALNEEALELQALGVDVVQFDEPAWNVYMPQVAEWGMATLERAAQGLTCTTAVHICYGYGIKANIDWKKTLGESWRHYETPSR